MSTEPPDGPEKAKRPHGTPPGQGTVTPAHGGRIGNPGHEVTEERRAKIRTLAKTMRHEVPAAKEWIAAQAGISVATLDRYYREDLVAGRAEVVASMGATLIGVALGTITNISRERLDAIKFALPRIGGWSSKVEMTGPNDGPVEYVDLSRLSSEQLEEYGRLAAIAEGLDPEEVIGPRTTH